MSRDFDVGGFFILPSPLQGHIMSDPFFKQNITSPFWLLLTLLFSCALSPACGLSPEAETAARTRIAGEIHATQTADSTNRTQIAWEVFATQTARAVLSITPTPHFSSTPRLQPSLTSLPSDTPGTLPDAVVTAPNLALKEGPGYDYTSLGTLLQGDELHVTGQYGDCAWIQVIGPDDQEGWVNAHIAYLQLNVTCSDVPVGNFRPLNGEIIIDRRETVGEGTLTVENGTLWDGLIILADLEKQSLVAFYIHSEKEVTLGGIPDGEYILFFSTGEDWNTAGKSFSKPLDFKRFEDTLLFRTTKTQYTIWSLTLHPVVGGEAATESVNPEDFPSLEEQP